MLMVTPYFPPTIKGPSLHVYHLVKNLKAQGVYVHVHTVKFGKTENELGFKTEDARDLDVSYFKPSFDPRRSSDDQPISLPYITSTISESDSFDLVHIHDFPKLCNDALILALKRLKPKKLVVLTPHGQGVPAPTYNVSSKLYWSLGIPLRVLRSVDNVITVTPLQKQAFDEVCEKQKVSMISEAIPPHYFVNKPNFLDDGKLKILYIGRIVKEKGISDLLYAVNALLKMGKNKIELRCIGPDYGFMQEAFGIIKELGLSNFVSILGPVSEEQKIANLDWCDVLVLPSYYEAFGIPIVEAMARAKPVIATKTIGAMSLVQHNKTGFLADFRDPKGLADKIAYFSTNANLKYRMGQEAIKHALQFSMQNMTNSHLDLYQKLVGYAL